MAYVLGYLYADGSLEDASYLRGKYTRVSSTDKSTIIKIKRWLASKHTIVGERPTTKNGKVRHLLRIGNHKLYASLLRHGLYPNKSLSIQFPKIPTKYLHDFIRGYFDGDGCVHLKKSVKKVRPRILAKKLLIIFTSGSENFLKSLCDVLHTKLKLRNCHVFRGGRAFRLCYSTLDSILLFKFMYKNVTGQTLLKRKSNKFKKYFLLHPEKIDSAVKKVLNR